VVVLLKSSHQYDGIYTIGSIDQKALRKYNGKESHLHLSTFFVFLEEQ
jgi:hypothetical protein